MLFIAVSSILNNNNINSRYFTFPPFSSITSLWIRYFMYLLYLLQRSWNRLASIGSSFTFKWCAHIKRKINKPEKKKKKKTTSTTIQFQSIARSRFCSNFLLLLIHIVVAWNVCSFGIKSNYERATRRQYWTFLLYYCPCGASWSWNE